MTCIESPFTFSAGSVSGAVPAGVPSVAQSRLALTKYTLPPKPVKAGAPRWSNPLLVRPGVRVRRTVPGDVPSDFQTPSRLPLGSAVGARAVKYRSPPTPVRLVGAEPCGPGKMS